jgi:hypothetical protein
MVWKNYTLDKTLDKMGLGQNGSIIFFQVLLVMFLTDEAEKWKVGVLDIWQRTNLPLTRLWLQENH